MVLVVKNPPGNARDIRDEGLIPGLGRSPGEGNSNPSSILPWRISWKRSLVDYSPWGYKDLEMTEST